MRAAIYARVSHEDDDTASEIARSVPIQTAGARAFIRQRGWVLSEQHVYQDEGVSGALFSTRPEFQRMMRDAHTREFDVLVLFDLDRFGRHGHKTMVALNELADLGIAIWDYGAQQVLDLDTFEGRLNATLKAEFAQQYREQISKHERRTMRAKAAAGLVTGGTVFGYRNDKREKGKTVLIVNEAEAAVVRDIFQRAAAGEGYRSIAAALNRMKLPSPRAQQGRASGWSSGTVRAILERPLYRGEMIYGRTIKAYGRDLKKARPTTKRERGQLPTDPSTWIRVSKPELAIISPDLAERVDERRSERRHRYRESLKRTDGRMPEKASGKYLLSGGMLICPTCGGHFEARKWPWKGHPPHVYICATRRRKPGVCNNTLALPIDETDARVLTAIEHEVLEPETIDRLLTVIDGTSDDVPQLKRERAELLQEKDRLIESIAKGVPADAVAEAIRERERQIKTLDARIAAPRVAPNRERMRQALEKRAADWKSELRQEPHIARLVLRRLIGPIVLWDENLHPRPSFVKWNAMTKFDGLFDGVDAPSSWLASLRRSQQVDGLTGTFQLAA